MTTSEPDSAGGMDPSIRWQNRSGKTINYDHFTVEAFNRVGDPVDCTIRDYGEYGRLHCRTAALESPGLERP